jgi:predicted alpha/beta-fold hydrolase
MRSRSGIGGHLWTIWAHARDRAVRPSVPTRARLWRITIDDPQLGSIALSGVYHERPGADAIAVLVHGMGGSADSSYCRRMAAVADGLGMSSLRVNVRGADLAGEDVFHAGQWGDLRAVLDSAEVARHRIVVVVGFSLGGHTVLRLAVEDPGPAGAVAAVCAPVDLAASCSHIDSPGPTRIYRAHLLRGLRAIYAAVAARRPMPLGPRQLRAISGVREWDECVIVPRFGFATAEEYYRGQSVAPRLDELRVPALYVGAEDDPMVAPHTVRPALVGRARDRLEVVWLPRAGHVGFEIRAGHERRILERLVARARLRS